MKVFYIIVIIAALFFSTTATAQQQSAVKGKVVTAEGKIAEDISVQLLETKQTVATDKKGEYKITDVKPGRYTLRASSIGLVPVEKQITIGMEELEQNFTLLESFSELKEIVITTGKKNKFASKKSNVVAKMPLNYLENPQVYTSIPKVLFVEQMITDIGFALKNSAGLYKINNNRGINIDGASYYSLRGFRTEVSMMDGLPAQTNGEIDPSNIEKVEVIKGPSGTLFGGAVTSFGGLINLVTKKPVDTLGGEIAYTGGTFGLNRLTLDVYGPASKDKKLLFRLNGAYQYQGSFQDAGFRKSVFFAPVIEYNASDRLKLSLNTSFYTAEATSPSVVFLNRTRQFIAKTPQELNFDWKRSYTSNDLTMKTPTVNIQGKIDYKLSDNWTSQTVYSSNNRRSSGFYQYQFIRGATSDEMVERNISLQNSSNIATNIQQNFMGDFKVAGLRNRLVVGLDYLNQKINNNFSPYILFDNVSALQADNKYVTISRPAVEAKLASSTSAPTKTESISNVYSAYASNILNVTDKLLAILSLRVDRFQNKGTLNQATNDYVANSKYMQTAVSPKFGLVYQVVKDEISVFANYMNGFRNVAPVSQPLADISGTFKPQQANQFEAGVKMDLFRNRLSLTASYYDIKVKNTIRTEVWVRENVNYNITVQNGNQNSKGFEVEVIANPFAGLNIIAGYGYNDSKLTKSSVALEGRRPAEAGPAYLANLWMSYTLDQGSLKGLGLGFGGNYVGKHLTANSAVTGIFTLPAYTLINATAFYDAKRYRLGLKVDNLTDRLYFTGQGVINPQMPRSVSANITVKF